MAAPLAVPGTLAWLGVLFLALGSPHFVAAQVPGEIQGQVVNVQDDGPVAGVSVEVLLREGPPEPP